MTHDSLAPLLIALDAARNECVGGSTNELFLFEAAKHVLDAISLSQTSENPHAVQTALREAAESLRNANERSSIASADDAMETARRAMTTALFAIYTECTRHPVTLRDRG